MCALNRSSSRRLCHRFFGRLAVLPGQPRCIPPAGVDLPDRRHGSPRCARSPSWAEHRPVPRGGTPMAGRVVGCEPGRPSDCGRQIGCSGGGSVRQLTAGLPGPIIGCTSLEDEVAAGLEYQDLHLRLISISATANTAIRFAVMGAADNSPRFLEPRAGR